MLTLLDSIYVNYITKNYLERNKTDKYTGNVICCFCRRKQNKCYLRKCSGKK